MKKIRDGEWEFRGISIHKNQGRSGGFQIFGLKDVKFMNPTVKPLTTIENRIDKILNAR